MSYQDKKIACRDCGREFTFTAQEQQLFKERDFSQPTRCPDCHDKACTTRSDNRGGGRVKHAALCSACGGSTELSFKPTPGRPVYCPDCFSNRITAKRSPVPNSSVVREPLRAREEKSAEREVACTSESGTFGGFGLDERLERAIREAGFQTPTPVQIRTIPIGLSGRDLIGTAQTGTGKTAAFALPILQHLLANPARHPCTRALVITPTRELAEQVNDAFRMLAKHTKIRSATVYGGVGMAPQEKALKGGVEVIVACPGRVLDHIERGNADFRGVEKLVLDEADRMLDMGFLPQIRRILSQLPRDRQNMLFSATFADELTRLAAETLNKPERVDVDLYAPAKTVAHALYPCPQHLKTSLVIKLLNKTDTNSVLIFTRTKHRANRVAKQIEGAGYAASALHSNKSQNQRQAALDDFRAGRRQILVATDIAARGLDVETISHVINYDIPDTADSYIHRIGRTGRAEREGDALTLITKDDAAVVWEIEKGLGGPIERRKLDDFDYNAPAPHRDEFKRAPLPPRRPKSDQPRARTNTRSG